jgi:hypothetical protein
MSSFRFDPHTPSGGWQQGDDDEFNPGWSLGGGSFMDTLDDQFNQGYDRGTSSSDAQHPLFDNTHDPHPIATTSSHRITVPSQQPLLNNAMHDSHGISIPSCPPMNDLDTLQDTRSNTDMSLIQLGELPPTDVMHVCLFLYFNSFNTNII